VVARQLEAGLIVLDTSGVVALFVRSDPNHASAVGVLRRERQPVTIPTGIMAEIAFLLEARSGEHPVLALLDSLLASTVLWSCGDDDIARVRELMLRYADMPLGYADATVIACAERNGQRVLTFDYRHFGTVAREGTFSIASAT
jgi:predicted nucleic acid-binding protein